MVLVPMKTVLFVLVVRKAELQISLFRQQSLHSLGPVVDGQNPLLVLSANSFLEGISWSFILPVWQLRLLIRGFSQRLHLVEISWQEREIFPVLVALAGKHGQLIL